jgi:hypothetical protein
MNRSRGQASIETAALLPALLVLGLCCWQALLAGWASICAEHAARAAAQGRLSGAPPAVAARAVLPGLMRNEMRVEETGGKLRVRLTVPAVIPGFHLDVSADAEAVGQ